MKKFILIVVIINASLLLLGGVLLGLGILLGGKTSFSFNLNDKEFIEPVYVDNSFNLDDFSSMNIDIKKAKLYIEESDKCGIEYHLLEDLVPEINVENGKLSVVQKDNNFIPVNILTIQEEQYIKIYATKDQIVDIQSSSGGVEIKNVNIDGKITSQSGSLSIEGSEGDSLDIKVSSGRTTIDNVKYNSLKSDQSSGKFIIKDAEVATLNVRSLSGGIDMENVTAESIEGNSTSGGVDFTNVNAKKANLDVTSGSFNMDGCEIDDLIAESTSGGVKAEDTRIDNANLDVSSGGVNLNLSGDVNDYDFDLSVTSGSIRINDEKKDGDYILSTGKDKKIKVETSSGGINININ